MQATAAQYLVEAHCEIRWPRLLWLRELVGDPARAMGRPICWSSPNRLLNAHADRVGNLGAWLGVASSLPGATLLPASEPLQ